MDRSVINPMEQMRDFDFVMFEHDVLVALGGLVADITSGLPQTVLGGLVGSQTTIPSLGVNISAGRIYQLAPSDTVSAGSIPADTSVIVQQGYNPAQIVTLVAPAPGQSQWNLIQAQFSQVDAVRAGDPNGGIVPFYNAANPTQPTSQSINTIRKGTCVLQVVTGSAATTGTEVPPQATGGWVPLYLIDLAGNQTQITTGQILVAGPSIGTGVPSNYAVAPFLAGLLASHHGGTAGQSPKIKLGSEVQGLLPYANMSPVRTLLTSNLTVYVATTGNDANSGTTPSLPFLTLQAAVNSLYRNYDFNGFSGTISVANGTYAVLNPANQIATNFSGMPVGLSNYGFFLTGNPASPGSVTLSCSNGIVIQVTQGASITITGFTFVSSGTSQNIFSAAGYGVVCSGAYMNINNCVMGSCGTGQLVANGGGTIGINGPLTFTGTTQYAIGAGGNGGQVWANGMTLTVTGLTLTGPYGFVQAAECGVINSVANTFVGTATGSRYYCSTNGVINAGGAGINYFPGNAVGNLGTGGQYV